MLFINELKKNENSRLGKNVYKVTPQRKDLCWPIRLFFDMLRQIKKTMLKARLFGMMNNVDVIF